MNKNFSSWLEWFRNILFCEKMVGCCIILTSCLKWNRYRNDFRNSIIPYLGFFFWFIVGFFFPSLFWFFVFIAIILLCFLMSSTWWWSFILLPLSFILGFLLLAFREVDWAPRWFGSLKCWLTRDVLWPLQANPRRKIFSQAHLRFSTERLEGVDVFHLGIWGGGTNIGSNHMPSLH